MHKLSNMRRKKQDLCPVNLALDKSAPTSLPNSHFSIYLHGSVLRRNYTIYVRENSLENINFIV